MKRLKRERILITPALAQAILDRVAAQIAADLSAGRGQQTGESGVVASGVVLQLPAET